MIRRIDSILAEYESLKKEILEIIGYSDFDDSPILLEPNVEWIGNSDRLVIAKDGFDGDLGHVLPYTISSLGMRGEKLYMGEKEGLYFFMAYPEDENWQDTTLFILSASKRRLDLDIDDY